MTLPNSLLRPPHSGILPSSRASGLDDYDSSSDSATDTIRPGTRTRATFTSSPSLSVTSPMPSFLLQPAPLGSRSNVSSASSTPMPSRSTSPLPELFPFQSSSSCTSESEDDEPTPLVLMNRPRWLREDRPRWWHIAGISNKRRRRRGGRFITFLKKWTRRIVRLPFFPKQPITIVLTLFLLSIFAVSLTFLIIHILNPDKDPLPWRAYCAAPATTYFVTGDSALTTQTSSLLEPHSSTKITRAPFPPSNLDDLPPAGLFIGVFTTESAFERRMLIRTTWASHARSRAGAGEGDSGAGTSRTVVRFIMGQPRKSWDRRIKLEMDTYNDIVILPVAENMNGGKTHTFFSWAYLNAWVPPVYTTTSVAPPRFSYSNLTSLPPLLAPHDPSQAWEDQEADEPKFWVRPDFVVKADDDSFVMLAELESRLRTELHTKVERVFSTKTSVRSRNVTESTANVEENSNEPVSSEADTAPAVESPIPRAIPSIDPQIYWGYLVKNRFMAGELYALSWSLTDYVARSPQVKALTKGAEDKQTAKWMQIHPQASNIRWVSDHCWIYDHPRAGTVYSHGFLFPSEVDRVKRSALSYMDGTPEAVIDMSDLNGADAVAQRWSYSTVSTWGVRYAPPLPDMKTSHSIEALVEGSEMSLIREGSAMSPEYAWIHREGRKTQYQGNRVGGTVVVHFIKKNLWFLETALALLEGDEYSPVEKLPFRDTGRSSREVVSEQKHAINNWNMARHTSLRHRVQAPS